MKIQTWKTICVAVVIGIGAAVWMPATSESAEPQNFRLRDLFKNKQKKSKPAAKTTEKAAPAKQEPAKTTAKVPVAKPKSTTTSKKEMSTSDRFKSLSSQLDKVGDDPDALLRNAREQFQKMKGKESSKAKKVSPADKAKLAADSKKAAKSSGKQKPIATAPAPAKEKKVVTAGVATPATRVADPSRPPSLVPVTTLAAASVITSRQVPAENLQSSLSVSDVPAPKALVAQKQKKKKKSAPGVMEITSDEVEMDSEKNTTTFIGNVDLKHPTFNLKSDRLVIYMHEEGTESEAPFKLAVATGARVIVERVNEKGAKDVGQSRKVVYDGLTGDLVLSGGPPQLQSGASLVKTNSQDATITLKKDGNHKVQDKGSGAKIIIPVAKKGGKGGKGPNLMPSKLGDISNRK
ncbi:MAG: hypothetical protein L3J39_00355 [Verrucomicrobiales bacterium]|nr:hypothetical protein [Verrucomicrobiales bacterium]